MASPRSVALLVATSLACGNVAAAETSATRSEFSEWSEPERAWWAFQPIQRPDVPHVEEKEWSANPIDRFVLRRLQSADREPAPQADRRALLRRATYTLTGLPPSQEETDAFLADERPDAYERLVDRLLQSPQYGEHWARYWLDLVRFAESDGYKQDAFRPEAYLYRDYVVRSFNDDKPYDQFVREQIAGDEIAPHDRDALVATMYLRHGIYEYNNRDVETQWQSILDEITDVTGEVFLGLGIGCARCHDHKFDPILQTDYYRLQAFFTPLLPRESMPVADRVDRRRHDDQLRKWEAATESVRRELRAIELPILLQHAGGEGFVKLPPRVKEMIVRWPGERTPYEKQIASMASRQFTLDHESLPEWLPAHVKPRWEALRDELQAYDDLKPTPLPQQAFAMSDVGSESPPTYVGRHIDQLVAPGFLSVLDSEPPRIKASDDARESTGRRTALADWIADRNNPLTARVIVNRLWQSHFGRGLSPHASDLGRLGAPPSHPELLDWLASELIDGGWRLKAIHRLMATSAPFRQASHDDRIDKARIDKARMNDPDNELISRMNARRLRAEEIRDSILASTGELDLTLGGESVDAAAPRRALYVKAMRNTMDPFLAAFDGTDGLECVAKRYVTTTPTQALLVTNGAWMQDRAQAMAARLAALAGDDPRDQVAEAYRLAYGRLPSSIESSEGIRFLAQGEKGSRTSVQSAGSAEALLGPSPLLVDFCHVLLCSNEFIYLD